MTTENLEALIYGRQIHVVPAAAGGCRLSLLGPADPISERQEDYGMNARLIHEHGAAKIEINGEVVSSVSFRSFWPQPGITRDFAEGGIRLMNVYPSGILCSLGVPYSQFGEFWVGEGEYDWDVLRRQMNQFIENAPNDYFSLILQLDTRDWFLKAHPECPNSFEHIPEACCSAVWRESARRCIRDTLAFLDREYPEKIYAVYVCAGGTCEWYNRNPMGYHPLKEAAFRAWCGDETRRLPTEEEMRAGEHGMVLCESEQNVVDYWHFLSDKVAETILEFAHEVKAYNPGLLVGCFSGYTLTHGRHVGVMCQNGLIKRLYDSSDIELIFSPASYNLRGLEDVSNSQLPMASARVHGKMYYHEIDNTAFPANANPYAQVLQQYAHRRHHSLEESIQYARRESACTFAALGTYWWFDMFGGWYDDKRLQKVLLDIGRAQERLYSREIASNAQVAYLLDEESDFYLSGQNLLHEVMTQDQMRALGRIGCQVDYYAAEDLLLPGFNRDQYRLYIFPNLVAPSEKMRRAIAELRAAGKSCLFVYAPGLLREGRFDPEGMRELTGLSLRLSDRPFGYTMAKDGAYNEDGMPRVFGGRLDDAGTFVEADEPEENVFGRGLVSQTEQFVVRERENGGFDAWAAQGVIPEYVLRPLARKAGAFIWNEDGLPVYTNSRMFSIFAHEAGTYTVRVPWESGRLEDMYTGETHEIRPGEPIELTFGRNECKCFIHE